MVGEAGVYRWFGPGGRGLLWAPAYGGIPDHDRYARARWIHLPQHDGDCRHSAPGRQARLVDGRDRPPRRLSPVLDGCQPREGANNRQGSEMRRHHHQRQRTRFLRIRRRVRRCTPGQPRFAPARDVRLLGSRMRDSPEVELGPERQGGDRTTLFRGGPGRLRSHTNPEIRRPTRQARLARGLTKPE